MSEAQMKVVYVKWRDSAILQGTTSISQAANMGVMIFESVGYLLAEFEDRIIICQDIDNKHQVRATKAIPRENIQVYDVLERGES